MVEFNPENSVNLHPESGKSFGGVTVTLDEWSELDVNSDLLQRSIEEIYPSEDPEYYSINQNKTHYSGLPTTILLIDVGSRLIPLHAKETTVDFIYRGREDFSKITRTEGDEIQIGSAESAFEGEEVPEITKSYTEYRVYTQDTGEPVGYIPVSNSHRIVLDGSYYSTDNVYVASDQFLVELLGITDLYLEKTV